MKKFLIFSIVSLVSVASYCLSEAKSEVFKHRAYRLLNENAAHLILTGDVSADEKLSDILETVKVAAGHSLSCTDSSAQVARCTLFIEHRPLGETAVIFEIRLDESQMPKRIMGDVEISRGD